VRPEDVCRAASAKGDGRGPGSCGSTPAVIRSRRSGSKVDELHRNGSRGGRRTGHVDHRREPGERVGRAADGGGRRRTATSSPRSAPAGSRT
jgi:hypothetical protein